MLVDLDAFFASVEQLDHPEWRGKPVIVGGDADKRGVVSTCSYEARAFGVRSAMPARQAAQLCPQAIWTHGNFARYKEMSNAVMAILRDETPHVQQVSIDEAFMDVSPTTVNTEHPVLIAQRIQARVEELGVTCSIGVGTTKSVAKVASDMDKPRGLTVVYPGTETQFLSPLPVRALSGVGAAAERELKAHGVFTLADMAAAEESLLRKIFGKNSVMMRRRAQGGDMTPVDGEGEPVKSISHETSFAVDLTERADIEAAIATMAAKVGRRLRKKGLEGRTLSLRMRYSNRSVRSVQKRLDVPSDDELAFTPLLFSMLDELWAPGVAIRLVGVAMTGFGEEAVQESLFDALALEGEVAPRPALTNEKKRRGLIQATDAVRNKFGETAVQYGRELRSAQNTTGSSSKNPEDYK